MIIKIDESIYKALEVAISKNDSIELLKDLEYNRSLGYIVVEVSKLTCIRLINLLDNEDRRIEHFLKNEKSKITFNQELLNTFKFKLYVFHSDFFTLNKADSSLIYFDIKNYSENKFSGSFHSPFEKPKLITENSLSDGKILKKICEKYFSKILNVCDYHICIERKNGGGDGTGDEIFDSDTSPLNLFAIVDSDKKHPNDCYGKTAKKVITTYKKLNLLHNYRILNVHEIENIFPIDWFSKKANQNQKNEIEVLKKIQEIDERSLFYYDFKDSFGYSSIFIKEESPLSSYWKPIFATVLNHEKIDSLKLLQSSLPENKDVKILGSFGTLFNAVKIDFLSNKLHDFQQHSLNEEWNDLSAWMVERFICSKPCRF